MVAIRLIKENYCNWRLSYMKLIINLTIKPFTKNYHGPAKSLNYPNSCESVKILEDWLHEYLSLKDDWLKGKI